MEDFINSDSVLNLIITGIPSIPCRTRVYDTMRIIAVLNLIITGIPSIQNCRSRNRQSNSKESFKPYYNWNTFNTLDFDKNTDFMVS